MNELDIKRLERNLNSTRAYLDRPLYQHMIINALIWALIMGPIIFLITYYEASTPYNWGKLPMTIFQFAIGGVVYALVMHLFYLYLKRNLLKKLKKAKPDKF